MPEKLLAVLRCIKDNNLTLPVFLEQLFRSKDADVAKWTGLFYENDGAERVIKIWSRRLRRSRWEEGFVNSAVDVVVNRTLKHLESPEIRKEWLLPYSTVTERRVTSDLMDDFGLLLS